MTAAVLDRPVTAGERPAAGEQRAAGERPAAGERLALFGGGTLEELLNGALDRAGAEGSTECPVCHAAMRAALRFTRAGAREATRAAECGGCGSRLS
jgi:hypothetical protein